MNLIKILVLAGCCVTATIGQAADPKTPQKEAQPMSEPNPVKAYVNVVPQNGEGRETSFILCLHSEKGCEKPVHTKKHLAVSNNSLRNSMGTVK